MNIVKFIFRRIFKTKCKHEWELLGGAGSVNSGFLYRCKKCPEIAIDVETQPLNSWKK